MSFLSEIFNDVVKCCCPFLQDQHEQQQIRTPLEKPLIQMNELNQSFIKVNKQQKNSRRKTTSCHQRISAPDSMQDFQEVKQNSHKLVQSVSSRKNKKQQRQIDYPEHQSSDKNEKLKRVLSKTFRNSQMKQQRKSGSESSFQTIKSTASRPISRRNFKVLRTSSNFFSKHRSIQKQQDFYSVNQSQNSSMDQNHVHRIIHYNFQNNALNNYDGIDLMNQWIKKQYEQYPNKQFRPKLSQITKMKLETKDTFDNIVHKLQDYYTFYYQDQGMMSSSTNIMTGQNLLTSKNNNFFLDDTHKSHFYQSENHKMVCSVTKAGYGKSLDGHKNNKYMSLIILPHCSLSPMKFLQWFNQIEVQSRLYSFNKIYYLQNSQRINDKITLEYPLTKVEQYNQLLLGKKSHVLIRQIQVVKFQYQQDRQTLLQVCFQALDQNTSYQRLIRITAQGIQGCRVEIYVQSSQNIILKSKNQIIGKNNFDMTSSKIQQIDKQFDYFSQKWKKFQQSLMKDYIISKKQQIFQN